MQNTNLKNAKFQIVSVIESYMYALQTFNNVKLVVVCQNYGLTHNCSRFELISSASFAADYHLDSTNSEINF